jgi:hypothetical protein
MTNWQKIALAHPCLHAIETTHPRFGHVAKDGTVLVTINTGYE